MGKHRFRDQETTGQYRVKSDGNVCPWEAPLFVGPLPLEYQSELYDIVPASIMNVPGGNGVTVQSHFGNFVASYVYSSMNDQLSHIPVGAVVSDEDGKDIFAEARKTSKRGGGRCCVKFRARSTFNGNGYKVTEVVLEGRKDKDFFYLWPIGG